MKAILWGTGAARDISTIVAEIALENPAAAKLFLRAVRLKVDRLSQFPLIGAMQAGRPSSLHVRRLVHGSYLIYYTVHRTEIRIRAVVHGARLFQRAWLHRP